MCLGSHGRVEDRQEGRTFCTAGPLMATGWKQHEFCHFFPLHPLLISTVVWLTLNSWFWLLFGLFCLILLRAISSTELCCSSASHSWRISYKLMETLAPWRWLPNPESVCCLSEVPGFESHCAAKVWKSRMHEDGWRFSLTSECPSVICYNTNAVEN